MIINKTPCGALPLILLSASLSLAAPAPEAFQEASLSLARRGGATFSLPVMRRPVDGMRRLIRMYHKYNMTLPPALQEGANRPALTVRGNDATTPDIAPLGIDEEYIVPVQFGTPPQTLYMDADTGSADLWVMTTKSHGDLQNLTAWDPSKSSTAHQQNGSTWRIQYGDGSGALGDVWIDKVTLGGVTSPKQVVQTAVETTADILSDGESGLLGLGMSSGSTVRPKKALTFFDNIRASLAKPLFTANLRHNGLGTYDFGYINKSAYTGSIKYVPIEPKSIYWQFNVTGHRVGGKDGAVVQDLYTAIADTGSTLLLVPETVFLDYYDQVEGAEFDMWHDSWIFPCTSKLPDFTFLLGSYQGNIPGDYLNYGYIPSRPTYCCGGLQSSEGRPFAVFGDMVLKAQFVVFDGGNKRLGFANKPTYTK